MRISVLTAIVLVAVGAAVAVEPSPTFESLQALLDSRVEKWRFQLGDTPGAERPDFDDSSWQRVEPGFKWWPHDSIAWFRTRVTIPESVSGIPVVGHAVRLRVGVDNKAQPYVNGVAQPAFDWDKGDVLLTESARPGEVITVALRAINEPGNGQLMRAYLTTNAGDAIATDLTAFMSELDRALSDQAYLSGPEARHWKTLVEHAIQTLDLDAYRAGNAGPFKKSLAAARSVLVSDKRELESRLAHVAKRLEKLKLRIDEARQFGNSGVAYFELDARVIESFLQYVREDVAEENLEHQIRGLKAARYIDALCSTSNAALARVLRERTILEPFPRYQTGPVEIRDGNFYQGNQPIFFTGVGHFGQVRSDTPILTQYGLNIIQIEIGPNSVLPARGIVNADAIRENIVKALDNAAAHNVMVNVLISPHYFPEWALDEHPELRECGMGFLKYCIDAPESREILRQFVSVLMPIISGHPALHSICLSNEPQYKGRCAYSRQAFHEWLQKRHSSLNAANAAYGTSYASFDDVPVPDDALNYALFFDWCCFNQDRFVAFHEFLRDEIRKYDANIPVHAKVMSQAFEEPGRFEAGIDYEAFPQLGTISGNDCWNDFETEKTGEYQQRWLIMAMNYTLQHSVAPANPIFNSENHIIVDGDKHYIPACHIRTAYWLEALHGQGATTTWVWDRGQSGDLAENILTRVDCVHGLGKIALDLNRLAPQVAALQHAKAEAAIFFSHASLLPSRNYVEEAKAAFEGAYFTDTTFDFVTESQAVAGRLKDYKLVLVPSASHVPQPVYEAFQEYLNAGGTLIVTDDSFACDEYGRPRNEVLKAQDATQLRRYSRPMPARAYREVIDVALDEADVNRPLRLEGPHGEIVWGVNLRTTASGGKLLASLVNLTRVPKTVCIRDAGEIAAARDLLTNESVDFPATLNPLDPVLLEIQPARADSDH
ncbi:MAG: beta-galactosidase [Candidatus Hydrogenedentes bacterium]|nr:beta-galactosidase [Candidatus Hydrogenedentota bacterium]